MLKKLKTKKGFFFVVTSLIILSYIMGNLVLWSKIVSLQEERYSENFKLSNLEYISSQLTDDKMNSFSQVSATYALFKLNHHSINNSLNEGLDWDYQNINNSMRGLILNGTTDPSYFTTSVPLIYSEENRTSYSFVGFFEQLNNSFSKVGMELSNPTISDFSFNQSSIDSVSLSFILSFSVQDGHGGQATFDKTIPISLDLPLQGLVDPSVAREMQDAEFGSQLNVEKQMFFNSDDYSNPTQDLLVNETGSGQGQGWFYGPVYNAENNNPPGDDLKFRYVLMGNESEILAEEHSSFYGAYILISNDPLQDSSLKNTEKPIFVSSSEPTLSQCEYSQCILFVSEYSADAPEIDVPGEDLSSKSYNIESIRDFVICGYYLQHEEGPSYLQKLLSDSYQREGEDYGMASFLVWQGIEAEGVNTDLSRLDLDFFNGVDALERIRGLPGCKDGVMCGEDLSYVGQFKLSSNATNTYLGDPTTDHFECDDWSECEEVS